MIGKLLSGQFVKILLNLMVIWNSQQLSFYPTELKIQLCWLSYIEGGMVIALNEMAG